MATRLDTTLDALKSQGKKALIPYVMAGDSDPSVTVPLLHRMVEAGSDIIEVGLPFSDPMADGPVIALAAERALAAGTSTRGAIEMIKTFRRDNTHTPIVVMGYLNAIEIMGYDRFLALAKDAGVDGVLMVDLPPEEAGDFSAKLRAHDMNLIFLISPTTKPERTRAVLEAGSGYIYYVSLKGVTGSANINIKEVSAKLSELKTKTDLPICVGFGIRDAESASALASVSDGVIVGSALVKNFDSHPAEQASDKVVDLLSQMRQAMDA